MFCYPEIIFLVNDRYLFADGKRNIFISMAVGSELSAHRLPTDNEIKQSDNENNPISAAKN